MMNTTIRALVIIMVIASLALNASAEVYSWTHIPHVAAGSGYTSYLTIRDPHGTGSRWIFVYFNDDKGQKLSLNVEGVGQVTEFSFQSAPFQEKSFTLSNAGFVQGSIQIAAQGIGTLSASLRFAVADGSGNVADVVGILPAEPNREWTLSVEKRKPADDTGVAIANPWSSAISGYFELYQGANRVPGTSAVPWALNPSGHQAVFVSQLFPGVSYAGVATLRAYSASNTFCAVALRADGAQYSSLQMDPGVQYWNVSYVNSSGTMNGSWAWRFLDGYSFMGFEQNAFNDYGIRLRGTMAWDINSFVAEWNYVNTDGAKGTILYQGVPGKEGNADVINGTRIQIDKDGNIISNVTFKATRLS